MANQLLLLYSAPVQKPIIYLMGRGQVASRNFLFSPVGQSTVQVLIGVALTGIVVAIISAMLTHQQRATLSLRQKLALLDMHATVSSALSDGWVCYHLLNGQTFDATAVSETHPRELTPALPIYKWVRMGPPIEVGPPLVQVGSVLSQEFQNVTVSSIRLLIHKRPPAGSAWGPNTGFQGTWEIRFDQTNMVPGSEPIRVGVVLKADTTNPANAIVTGCQGAKSETGPFPGQTLGGGFINNMWWGTWSYWGVGSPAGCPAGYTRANTGGIGGGACAFICIVN